MDDDPCKINAATDGFERWGPRVVDAQGRVSVEALPSSAHLAQALLDAWQSGSPARAVACGTSRFDLDPDALERLEKAWRRSRWDQGSALAAMPSLAWRVAELAWPQAVATAERERLAMACEVGAGNGSAKARSRL